MPLGRPLLDALARMGYGGIVLDAAGQVLSINPVAERLLNENAASRSAVDSSSNWRQSLKSLLRLSETERTTIKEGSWIVIRRDTALQRPLILHAIPIAETSTSGNPHTVVIMVDLQATPRASAETLQTIFGLTSAEAKLARAVGSGKSLDDIAEECHVSVGTVRKQLASVFAKTHTHRQAELVALLVSVAILP